MTQEWRANTLIWRIYYFRFTCVFWYVASGGGLLLLRRRLFFDWDLMRDEKGGCFFLMVVGCVVFYLSVFACIVVKVRIHKVVCKMDGIS
jgi:hypothetical protein